MTHTEIQEKLSEYIDSTLPDSERRGVEQHLRECETCSTDVQKLRSLKTMSAGLPRDMQPRRDLWAGISQRLEARTNVFPFAPPTRSAKASSMSDGSLIRFSTRIAAALALAIGGFWLASRPNVRPWEVAKLEGTPRIGDRHITENSRLGVGDWLETDASSRAQLTIADIGEAEIGPNSRLRLLATRENEHRLEMTQGRMSAWVSAPPRIFIVETPSATAVDLGCSYDLYVNEAGNGTVHVANGEVSLEYGNQESFVPSGAMCETMKGLGPGTPYSDLSSEALRKALREFDFGKEKAGSLETVLQNASNVDAITLWHLLQRVDASKRETVFDRFAALLPPPKQVTKEGVLRLDRNMLEDWLNEFAARSYSLKRLF